ncbi:hypothetical protein ACS0TY_006728 [Phlomoides rotata]
MASSELMRDLFGEDFDDEVNTQGNGIQNNSSSVPTENNDEEDMCVIEPGMVFNSVDSLFDVYQEHARVRGYSVVKRTLAKRNEREPKYALIVCDKADRNFYHLMDIDEDGRLRNILWIHPRSKAAYEDFHDVDIGFMKSG